MNDPVPMSGVRVPKRRVNQYTMAPLSEDEIKRRFIEICRQTGDKGQGGGHEDRDWLGIFTEWIHSEPSDYRTAASFVTSKGIHGGSLQKRGGRAFWNLARDSVRANAAMDTIRKAPDVLARRIERGLEVTTELHETASRMLKRIKARLDADPTNEKSLEAGALQQLSEAITALNENLRLFAGGQPQGVQTGVNLYQVIVQGLADRDREHGVSTNGYTPPAQ